MPTILTQSDNLANIKLGEKQDLSKLIDNDGEKADGKDSTGNKLKIIDLKLTKGEKTITQKKLTDEFVLEGSGSGEFEIQYTVQDSNGNTGTGKATGTIEKESIENINKIGEEEIARGNSLVGSSSVSLNKEESKNLVNEVLVDLKRGVKDVKGQNNYIQQITDLGAEFKKLASEMEATKNKLAAKEYKKEVDNEGLAQKISDYELRIKQINDNIESAKKNISPSWGKFCNSVKDVALKGDKSLDQIPSLFDAINELTANQESEGARFAMLAKITDIYSETSGIKNSTKVTIALKAATALGGDERKADINSVNVGFEASDVGDIGYSGGRMALDGTVAARAALTTQLTLKGITGVVTKANPWSLLFSAPEFLNWMGDRSKGNQLKVLADRLENGDNLWSLFSDVSSSIGAGLGGATIGAVAGGFIGSFFGGVGAAPGAWLGGLIGGAIAGGGTFAEKSMRQKRNFFGNEVFGKSLKDDSRATELISEVSKALWKKAGPEFTSLQDPNLVTYNPSSSYSSSSSTTSTSSSNNSSNATTVASSGNPSPFACA